MELIWSYLLWTIFAYHYSYPNRTGTAVYIKLRIRNTGDAPLFLCSSIYKCKPQVEAYMSGYPAGIAILELDEPIVVNPGGEKLINVLIYIDGVFLNKTYELNITLKIGAIVKNITIKNVNWV